MTQAISSIVHYTTSSFQVLNKHIVDANFSKIFVLVDENTKKHCLPFLQKSSIAAIELIEIPSGEANKNIDTLQKIWEQLTNKGADRNSLLLNLGGGIITDMGGFAAATFKRGMRFINIPTTLLGLVDASVGGKTGIGFMGLKNQIGMFQNPDMTLIYDHFLSTLPLREFKSGMAEVIKYGLIDSPSIWEGFKKNKKHTSVSTQIIRHSIEIKERIVNLHAIETHFLTKSKKEQLLHGEAVAIGMILAAHLSFQTKRLEKEVVHEITVQIKQYFGKSIPSRIEKEDYSPILDLLKHDKKSNKGQTNFILLRSIGQTELDCQISSEEVIKAFEFYGQ